MSFSLCLCNRVSMEDDFENQIIGDALRPNKTSWKTLVTKLAAFKITFFGIQIMRQFHVYN